MGNSKSNIQFLKNSSRWPKREVTPVSVPTVQVSNEEWNKAVQVLREHEDRFDNWDIIFDSDLIEASDEALLNKANACIRALYFINKPAAGHRYVLTYLYHWGEGDDFQISIVDYNVSAETETELCTEFHFQGGGLVDLEDDNGNIIGKVYADTSKYTDTIAPGGAATVRMPYCNATCWRYTQSEIMNTRMAEIDAKNEELKGKVQTLEGVVSPDLLGTEGIEASDVVKCAAANAEVKALYMSVKPLIGHRFVLSYLYLQTSDNKWFVSIIDYNISAGTSITRVNQCRCDDKKVSKLIDVNDKEVGLIYLDSTHYTLIGDQGEGTRRLPYLLSAVYSQYTQQPLLVEEVESTAATSRSNARRVSAIEESLTPTLLGTAGTEASDVVKCEKANANLKALWLRNAPASGHRYVVTQMYLQTSDYSWYYTIVDYNVSAGTSATLVNALYAEDKKVNTVLDTNGNDIGLIWLDSDDYTLIADQGEGVARLPYLLEPCFDAESQMSIFKSSVNNRLSTVENKLATKIVTVWGDSITWGSAASANAKCYASLLQTMMRSAGYKHEVWNCGVGGDNMPTIVGRLGGTALYLTIDLTIPADHTESVVVDSVANYVQVGRYLKAACRTTEQIQLMMQGDLGRSHIDDEERDKKHTVNPIMVNGVPCVWSWEPEQEGHVDEGNFTLAVMEDQEDDVVLKAGTPIYPHGATFKSDVAILAMGTNDGWGDTDDYIKMVDLAIEALNTKRYIVCSPYGGTALSAHTLSDLQDLEAALLARYGARFFNWRKYLVEEGLTVEGLTPSASDTSAINAGLVPPSLLNDEVHPNDYGHDAIAKRLYQMMLSLGYLD